MKYIREIRIRAGMSQRQCAVFLGVSRSTLAMAEVNRRELPSHATVKLMELQKIAAQNDEAPLKPSASEIISAIHLLEQRSRACLVRAGRLRQSLEVMQGFRTRKQRMRWVHHKLVEDELFQEELQMSLLPYECKTQYRRDKLGFKMLVELRASALEAQARLAGNMIEQLELELQLMEE